MAISQETIEKVREESDIVSIVREYTALTRRGGNDWWGCCPFHNEKTASFHVDGDKKFYYCFGCHAGGDAIKFIMEMEKSSYSETIISLAQMCGIEVHYTGNDDGKKEKEEKDRADRYLDLYERVSILFNYLLTQNICGKKALEYIRERGIKDDVIAKFRLGYAPKDKTWLKKFLKEKRFSDEFLMMSGLFSKKYSDISFFYDRIMFPIMDKKGKCVAFGARLLSGDGPKYLNSGDMAQYKKGEVLYAFNLAKKAIRDTRQVIFCEGYMDCIAYHQCGINFAVAPLGTALTDTQIKIVKQFIDTVILSFDSDTAGIAATKRAIVMCRKMGLTCRIVRLEGGKDPAEIMVKLGKDVLTKYVDDAILDADFLLYRLGKEYAIDTIDGKRKACLSYFSYIDALPSSVQKEACIRRLSTFLSLSYEALIIDYKGRGGEGNIRGGKAERRYEKKEEVNKSRPITRKGRELKAVLAAAANIETAGVLIDMLSESDFTDDVAKGIFLVLKENRGKALGDILSILSQEESAGGIREGTEHLVVDAVSSGEYKGEDAYKLVKESAQCVKREALKRKGVGLVDAIALSALEGDNERMSEFLKDKKEIDSLSHIEKGAL